MIRNGIFGVVLVSTLMALAPSAFAQLQYGTTSINLAHNTVNIMPGQTISINYTLTLVSGKANGYDNINIVNTQQLIFVGVNGSLSNSQYLLPPASGILTIKPSPAVSPGSTFYMFLNATGSEPTASNAILTINIVNTTTTSSSTTLNNGGNGGGSSSSSTSTVGSGGGTNGGASSGGTGYYIIGAVVIIAIAAGAYWMMKGKK